MNKQKISIIIPCAGPNKKKGLVNAKCLSMLSSNETVIERQIRILNQTYNNPEIIVVVGFQSNHLIPKLPKGVKIVENEMFEETSVARSVSMALRVASNDNILIIYGNIVFNAELPKLGKNSFVVIDSKKQMGEDDISLNIVDNKISCFSYGFDKKWANMLYISKKDLPKFSKLIHMRENKRVFIHEILNKMIEDNYEIGFIDSKNLNIAKIGGGKDINI